MSKGGSTGQKTTSILLLKPAESKHNWDSSISQSSYECPNCFLAYVKWQWVREKKKKKSQDRLGNHHRVV